MANNSINNTMTEIILKEQFELDIDVTQVDVQPTLKEIFQLQQMMLASANQFDINEGLKHTFSEGAYARELLLPKGSLVVGKVHKHGHLNIVSKGLVIVWTTEGRREIDARFAPITFVSSPGTKRVVYSLEDTYWTTIHLTQETDLAKIEQEIIIPETDFAELLEGLPMTQITGEIL